MLSLGSAVARVESRAERDSEGAKEAGYVVLMWLMRWLGCCCFEDRVTVLMSIDPAPKEYYIVGTNISSQYD
jgi:hypothetical protein